MRLLIEEYKVRKDKFRNPKITKKQLWNEIVQKFHEKGYKTVTRDQLNLKMRNLKKTYLMIKYNNNKKKTTGRGRVSWEYFEDFEDIFREDKTVNFTETVSSLRSEPSCSLIASGTSHDIPDVQPSTSTSQPNTDVLDTVDSNVSIISLETTPHVYQSTPKKNMKKSTTGQAVRGRHLFAFRKKQLEIEERRVEEIIKLTKAIERSNEIQEERNIILRQLVNKE